jgi:hypothetical protein
MALAPALNAADLIGAAEIVAITVLAQPPPLAGGLTGLATCGLGTIFLAVLSAWIGKEKLSAAAAFASGQSAAHREPIAENEGGEEKCKRRIGRRRKWKKEERILE